MSRDKGILTVGVTGMNAKPDNPGPGLAVGRCLRDAFGDGIRIIGLSYDVLDPGLYLRDVSEAGYLLPYPSAGEQQLMERLAYIQEQESMDILIPCLDAELISFARLRHELEGLGLKMLIPDMAQLRERNKDRLGDLARRAGIRYPETRNVNRADFFRHCHDQGWNYPMVVKGVFYDASIVYSAEEAEAAFRRIAATWGLPVMVQRYVEGHEVNLTALGDGKGNLIGPVMMRKQAVTDKGKAWSGVTVTDSGLLEQAEKLARELQWEGPLEVEMLKDIGGQLLLIEINPRFPAWIYLSTGAGCNLPAALVRLIQGKKPKIDRPKAGVMMIRYASEIIIDLEFFETMAMNGSSRVLAEQDEAGEKS